MLFWKIYFALVVGKEIRQMLPWQSGLCSVSSSPATQKTGAMGPEIASRQWICRVVENRQLSTERRVFL